MRDPLGATPDFFGALAAKRRRGLVSLGGKPLAIPRARLRLHYELQDILTRDAPTARTDGETATERVISYVEAATGVDRAQFRATELVLAFEALIKLNASTMTPALVLAAQSKGGPEQRTPNALKYPGRWLASIVSTLAGGYGWTADYILEELGPEEAFLYVQEILYDEHQARAFDYSLSTVGRQKNGRQGPFKAPDWLSIGYPDQLSPASDARATDAPPMTEQMQPVGNIVSFAPRAQGA